MVFDLLGLFFELELDELEFLFVEEELDPLLVEVFEFLLVEELGCLLEVELFLEFSAWVLVVFLSLFKSSIGAVEFVLDDVLSLLTFVVWELE